MTEMKAIRVIAFRFGRIDMAAVEEPKRHR